MLVYGIFFAKVAMLFSMKFANRLFISKKGIVFVVSYLILSFSIRFVLPFGDEPDFSVRVAEVLNNEHPFYSPYNIFHTIIIDMDYQSNCIIDSKPLSLFPTLNRNSCVQPVDQILLRVYFNFLVLIPLLILVLVRVDSVKNKFYYYDFNNKIDSIGLTILFPSSLYYLGLFSVEQFFIILTFFIFLFWQRSIFIVLIGVLCFQIDAGNFIVVMIYYIFFVVSQYCLKKIKWWVFFILSLFVSCASLFFGVIYVKWMLSIPFLNKHAELILISYSTHQSLDKYPVLLRPVITLMSFIFYTAENIKVIIAYIIVAGFLLYTAISIFQKYKVIKETLSCNKGDFILLNKIHRDFLPLIVGIFFVVNTVFILPTYANAKYFFFLMPFIFKFLLNFYSIKNIYYFVSSLSVLVIVFLNLYYI